MAKGFYWGANNPYLRTIWVKVRRIPKGLNPSLMRIGPDANPAGIVFETLTNRDWGLGAGLGIFEIPSFETSAQTFFDESFGLSLIWTRSTSFEDFLTEIIDHVHATLFVSPRTGLLTLKPLRDDFDVETLRVISPSNARLTNFQRKTWGETANELVVTFTNPDNEKEETVVAQDLANIAMQGGIVSNGRNYYAIRNRTLAARVAERDLRASSLPLCTADVEMDRTGWDLEPGEPVILNWPEKGIAQVIMRVGVINYGTPGAGTIKFNLHEDIFSLGRAEYLLPPETGWVDPSKDPEPLENVLLMTAPAYLVARETGTDLTYPEVLAMPLAQINDTDDLDYELIGQVSEPNGDLIFTSLGAKPFLAGALLADAIVAEAETEITSFDSPTGASPLAGSLMLIGEGGEEDVEIVLVKAVSDTTWTLSRGVLDTVPKAWPQGTRVWSLANDVPVLDVTLRSEGESPEYRLLTRTSKGILEFDDATPETITLSARPHLPSRPADVAVGGVAFGTLNAAGLSTIPVEWANRNRISEITQILGWSDGSVTPEAGQTTSIAVLDDLDAVVRQIDGLTGTAFTLTLDMLEGETSGTIRVTSKRDGFESLQGHEIAFTGAPAPMPLSGSIIGGGTLSGDLTQSVALSGAIRGDGLVGGDLDVRSALAGSIVGLTSLSGNLTTADNLGGSIEGVGVLSANLTVTP